MGEREVERRFTLRLKVMMMMMMHGHGYGYEYDYVYGKERNLKEEADPQRAS